MEERKQHKYLVVDGLLNETGIRDEYEGEYLDPKILGISVDVQVRLREWVENYAELHYAGFLPDAKVEALDAEGMSIARAIAKELDGSKLSYYSDARSTKQQVPQL